MEDGAFLKEWAKPRKRGFWRFAFGQTFAMVAICVAIVAIYMAQSSSAGGGLFFAATIITVITLVRMPLKWRAAVQRYRALTKETSPRIFD